MTDLHRQALAAHARGESSLQWLDWSLRWTIEQSSTRAYHARIRLGEMEVGHSAASAEAALAGAVTEAIEYREAGRTLARGEF